MAGKRRRAARKKAKTVGAEDTLERRMKNFSKEVEIFGERLGRGVDRRERGWDSWFHRTFGLTGPVISSVFGIIILALVVWVLDLSNAAVKSVFLSGMQAFLSYNMGLFFLVFLFFSFMSYFSKESPVAYRPFSPVGTAVGITVGFWVASQVIAIASTSLSVHMLYTVSLYMEKGVFWVFLLVLFVGYAVFLARTGCCRRMAVEEKQPAVKTAVRKAGDVHRLYRSGNDRILGGVCGGIAEYLGADPVLIRLIWILGTFAWGAGIFFYIIAWIIIPRNPDHKWAER